MADKWDPNRVIVVICTTLAFAAISPLILFGISIFEVSSRIMLIVLLIGILYTLRDMLAHWRRAMPFKEKEIGVTARE